MYRTRVDEPAWAAPNRLTDFGFPTSAIGPSYIPITGGYGTTLSGASVTYGSNVLTFASAVTIPTWGRGPASPNRSRSVPIRPARRT